MRRKHRASGATVPLQRVFSAGNDAWVEQFCNCAFALHVDGRGPSYRLRCSEVPWRCPRSVPPTCNTGVHIPESAAASVAFVESGEQQNSAAE